MLTDYKGPCTITVANTVIDAKRILCDSLDIEATGVVISRSLVVSGIVSSPENAVFRWTMVDSEVNAPINLGTSFPALGWSGFTLLRDNIHGSFLNVYCHSDCTITDSWLHGADVPRTADWHLAALRFDDHAMNGGPTNALASHNTLSCSAVPTANDTGGCTADLGMLADFGGIVGVTIARNLFVAAPTSVAYCGYFGTTNAHGAETRQIVVRENVFQRGANAQCGAYGPATAFSTTAPGNVWSGNVWDDGTAVSPD